MLYALPSRSCGLGFRYGNSLPFSPLLGCFRSTDLFCALILGHLSPKVILQLCPCVIADVSFLCFKLVFFVLGLLYGAFFCVGPFLFVCPLLVGLGSYV